MILRVRVPAWELEEDGRVLAPGDEIWSWLTFREVEPSSASTEPVQLIRGAASGLPSWPGAEVGRHPVQITLDGATLYWDAPEPLEGEIEVSGTVSTNTLVAPDSFPKTHCAVSRVQMEWQDFTHQGGGLWENESGVARYEEVAKTYLPVHEVETELEPPTLQAAIREFKRRIPRRRGLRGGSFAVFDQGPSMELAVGARQTQWTGVLMDVTVSRPQEV